MRRYTRTCAVAGVMAVAAMLAPLASADAATSGTATVTGSITGSNLSLSTTATPTFSDNLDNGGNQVQTYTVPMTVQDTRGTGAGWNLTVNSTQFTTSGTPASTLATNASSITGVTSTCLAAGTCTNPANAVTYSVGVPAGTGTTPVKFFNAGANSGMGIFTVTPSVNVAVPQNTTAGNYTSTLTLSIVSGP